MKKIMSLLIALGILLGLAATSFAHQPSKHRVPVARERQQQQQQRIRQGIRSEELTRGEVHSLGKEQREIHQEIRQAHTDGVVTVGERRAIQQEQNQASRHIFRAKHNRRERN
jgi:hypothetical protein